MPWRTRKDVRKSDGSPVHYQFEQHTKDELPKAPMATIETITPETVEIQDRKRTIGLIQRIQRTLGINAEDPEDKRVMENIEKASSSNPVTKLQGRYWLAEHRPDVLTEIDREFPRM